MVSIPPRNRIDDPALWIRSTGATHMSDSQFSAASVTSLSSSEFLSELLQAWRPLSPFDGYDFQECRPDPDWNTLLYAPHIAKLPQPAIFTASDLARIVYYSFAGQLTPKSHPNSPEVIAAIRRYRQLLAGELDESYGLANRVECDGFEGDQFCYSCRQEYLDDSDLQISVSLPEATRPDTIINAEFICEHPYADDTHRLPWREPWWTSDSGFQVWLFPGGIHNADGPFRRIDSLGLIAVEALATTAAFEAGRRDIISAMQPILRTIEDSATSTEKATSAVQTDTDQTTSGFPAAPKFGYYYWGDGGILLRTCLDAVFGKDAAADEDLVRRIQNSVSLLANSDVVDHAGVSLALCIAAIESLLTNPGDKVAEVFANSCATLLQPDTNRRQDAIRDLKKVFDYRSSVLHGRTITADRSIRDQTRRLAAGILRAVASLKHQYLERDTVLTRKELRTIVDSCNREGRSVPELPDLSELLPTDVPKLRDQ